MKEFDWGPVIGTAIAIAGMMQKELQEHFGVE